MSSPGSKLPPRLMARLEQAWQGEVFGRAMYAAVADAQTDPFRRWQWQVLHQLEIETGEAMKGLLRRFGCNTTEDPASRQAGLAEAQRIMGLPWNGMMRAFASDLPDIIAEYEALARDCAFTGEDAAALKLLVDHEIASLAFAESELAGGTAKSAAPVLALLRNPPPQPA